MATTAWAARTEATVSFVTSRDSEGRVRRVRVKHERVILSRDGRDELRFAVSRRGGRVSLSDSRGTETGVAGTRGLWGTRDAAPAGGRREAMSPRRWAEEVERLIGWERAIGLLGELGALA